MYPKKKYRTGEKGFNKKNFVPVRNPGSGCGYSAGLHHVPGTIDDTAQQVWVTRIFCARSVVPVRDTPAGPVMIIHPVAGANVFSLLLCSCWLRSTWYRRRIFSPVLWGVRFLVKKIRQ